MEASKTKPPYSKSEDNYIKKCTKSASTVAAGLRKAAKALNRSETAISQRYYSKIKGGKKKPETVGSLAISPFMAPNESKSNVMLEHQKELDKSVRFTLASLAKGHENITIEVQGKQITAVFK